MDNNKKVLKPLLKYPGGKSSELPIILKNAPDRINNYIEPFLGGGAIYFAIEANAYYVNDKSEDLMLLYEFIKSGNEAFYTELETINNNWDLLRNISAARFTEFLYIVNKYKAGELNNENLKLSVSEFIKSFESLDGPLFQLENIQQPIFKHQLCKNIIRIIKRICKNEIIKEKILTNDEIKDNFECAIKSAYYMYFRELYNYPEKYTLSKPRTVAIFLFIREYCYSSMYRFNRDGKFNVPYGGISYNHKNLTTKILYYKSNGLKNHLNKTTFCCDDFLTFVRGLNLSKYDFMFLDPPYDTIFSEYDKNSFDHQDQKRLAEYLINECPCNFMIVIKKTDFMDCIYKNDKLHIFEFDKSYFVSFKNRNKKSVKHLLITNY